MYESRQQRPLARSRFLRRLAMHAGVVLVLIGVSLFGGMLGYMTFEGMVFLAAAALLHRIMHRFHWLEEQHGR